MIIYIPISYKSKTWRIAHVCLEGYDLFPNCLLPGRGFCGPEKSKKGSKLQKMIRFYSFLDQSANILDIGVYL